MDFQTVKTCFEKYTSYLQNHEGINLPEGVFIESMTIHEIDVHAQILFMDYVLKCEDKVNQFSVSCTLYKHVNSLIRQYMQDQNQKQTDNLKEQLYKLEDENKQLKNILTPSPTQSETKLSNNIKIVKENIKTEPKDKSRGWFY